MIRLIILDIDGIMTDGRKYYDSSGLCFAKTFCDKDWTTIKRFRAIGIPVVFLTGDPNINEKLANNRNLHVIVNRKDGVHTDKSDYLEDICEQYGCTPDQVCYLGDDLFDIGIMKMVKYSFCVQDSPKIVQEYASRIVPSRGGDNAVMKLFEILEYEKKIPRVGYSELMPKIYDLDKKEVF
jgi:3-deoxy-D-manno-octulosonate 8-phosphate phosphatase (KDO 8-P phosphatase)